MTRAQADTLIRSWFEDPIHMRALYHTIERCYVTLLALPPEYRAQVQAQLIECRDHLARWKGWDAERTQNTYEAIARGDTSQLL